MIAFNAAFVRQFIEVFAPGLPMMDWGCAMADVPWRARTFPPRHLCLRHAKSGSEINPGVRIGSVCFSDRQ